VKDWASQFAFKWVNLYRYTVEAVAAVTATDGEHLRAVGLYKLNSVDPQLESAWFQPLNLKCDLLVSKFAFKFNVLCCYGAARGNHPAIVKNELAVSALWLLSAHRPAALTLLGLCEAPSANREESSPTQSRAAGKLEEEEEEEVFFPVVAEEPNYRDLAREEWYPPGMTPPPPPTPPPPDESREEDLLRRAGEAKAEEQQFPPPPPPPKLELLLPVVRVLAGGRGDWPLVHPPTHFILHDTRGGR
jgi:hypothetical protein